MNILAVDLGTSSVRGLVLDPDCAPRPGALARRKVHLRTGEDGAGTLDGPAYLASLVECLDELAAGGHLHDVGLVALSAQWHSVLPLGVDGAPLGPVLTWLDTRPEPVDGRPAPADPEAFHQRTGTWLHRCYWTVRLPWLRERSGSRVDRFVGLVEYVLAALLDEAPMSLSMASGTGLLDLHRLVWDAEAAELAGVRPAELPSLAPQGWSGRLRRDYARRWPALARARWSAPVGDGAASNVGSGCVDPSRAAITVGTSAAVRVLRAAPVGTAPPPLAAELWRYRVDHEYVVTGAAYSSGGNLYAWARRELRLPGGAELEAALAAADRRPRVRVNPRFGGDRPPGLAPAGSGELAGLSFGSTAVDILAGMMTGLSRIIAADLALLEADGAHPTEVVLGGGAMAGSPWWRSAFVRTLAPRSVCYQRNPEVGAIGAALVATGRIATAAGIDGIGRTDEPGPPNTVGGGRSG